LVGSIALVACVGGLSQSSSGKLTKERAQASLTQWAGSNGRGQITVLGIQDVPGQNGARADVQFTNFTFNGDFGPETVSTAGYATFSHYNDGRWMLATVFVQGRDFYTWTPNSEVR
jgi:hypothetical protein